jgi:hypothetical protein
MSDVVHADVTGLQRTHKPVEVRQWIELGVRGIIRQIIEDYTRSRMQSRFSLCGFVQDTV